MMDRPSDTAGTRRAFMGVEASATGRRWLSRLDARGEMAAQSIAQRHQVSDLLARVLAGRDVAPESVSDYLNPSIKNLLPDPDGITDMRVAAARIADAILAREQIAVLGDYDVDGATSAALMTMYLRHCGLDPIVYIPDRLFEGYGPNVEAVRALAAKGTRLLVTVDCGTTSIDALAEAALLGLETVVVDHHQANEELPRALAVVNPNRQDCLSNLGHLAAVGLVFVTLVALNRELRGRGFWTPARPEPNLLDWLDLVALGTVADVAPLIGLNRAFVAKGLIAMRRRQSIGLTALMDVARLNGPAEAWHLGFMLGPRINAGGRIGRADMGVELLLEADATRAAQLATELDRLNGERRAIEQATVAEAEAEVLAALGVEDRGAIIVAAADGWHPGIVGLVASRLKEKFGRPAFAIGFDVNGIGSGSGRSIGGVDLGSIVRRAVQEGLAEKGGGHAMAAGITIRRERLGAFRAFVEEGLAEAVALAREGDALLVDGAVTAQGATSQMITSIAGAGPYGAGNPEPLFVLPRHTVAFAEEVGGAHVRVRLRSPDGTFIQAIAFRAAGQPLGNALIAARGGSLHAAGTLSIDRWQGAERVQFRISDVANATG